MLTQSLLVLQSVLSGLQVLNALLASEKNVPSWLPILVAVIIAGLQNYVQHAGNQATPKRLQDAEDLKKSAEK